MAGDGVWIKRVGELGSVRSSFFRITGASGKSSAAGGRIARWSPNRRELFYRTDDQKIMVATYTVKGSAFTVQGLRQWSQSRLADTDVLSNFDLSSDGRRILAAYACRPDRRTSRRRIMSRFMLNFFDEVRRRVTSGGR